MNLQLLSLALAWISLAVALLAFGYEDRKSLSIHVFTLIIFSFLFLCFYLYFFMENGSFSWDFLAAGLAIFMVSLIGLRKQLAAADLYIILISGIAVPFVSIPALAMTLGLTIHNKEGNHWFAWSYALAFIAVSIVEAIGLLILIY